MIHSKRIAVFGFGEEGISVANFLGKNNQITVIDDKLRNDIDKSFFRRLRTKNIKFFFGKKFPKDQGFDLLVRSPGFSPDHKKIKFFKKRGAVLTSATNIFFDNCPCSIIGVTGTKGKGTTATLIYKILKTKFRSVFLAGNIGTPMLDILPKLKKDAIAVLELSSFQLLDLKKSPHTAVILMVTSEHLDWHKNQGDYINAKKPIVFFQGKSDFAIVNFDFQNSTKIAKGAKSKIYYFSVKNSTNGIYLKGKKIVSGIGRVEEICDISKIKLVGKHNVENVLAAIAVAKIYSVKNSDIVNVLSSFRGLKNRLELVGVKNRTKFYNDSFSTVPETTIAAIESFGQNKVLILGGSSKNSDFSVLSKKIVNDSSIKAIILIGQEAKRIESAIKNRGNFKGRILQGGENMEEIVKRAYEITEPGDVVLFSPACASFDMFKNYKDRGDQFIKEVRSLRPKV